MRTLRLKISQLFDFSGSQTLDRVPDVAELTPLVLKQFGFLPQPLTITVELERFPSWADLPGKSSAGWELKSASVVRNLRTTAADGKLLTETF